MKRLALLLLMGAVTAFTVLADDSGRYNALISKAKERMEQQRPADALRFAQEAIRLDPTQWEAYVVATSAYTKSGDNVKARQTVEDGMNYVAADKKPVLQKLLLTIAQSGESRSRVPAGQH